MPLSSGKGAVFEFHDGVLELFEALGHIHLDEMKGDRLLRAEHLAGGDANEE